MARQSNINWYALGVIALIAVVAVGINGCAAYYESAAFNKLTGAKTTWRDAFWLELRVTEPVQQPQPSFSDKVDRILDDYRRSR